MEERYTKLYSLPENLYSYGAPVVVSAGALLKDNQQDKVLVQLKIRNIQRKSIKALTVRIVSFDTAGRKLGEETSFQYLDLNAKRDEEFGQKIPIILPDTSVRSFSVCVAEIIFDDQSIWTVSDSKWESMAKRIPLDCTISDQQLKSQFRIKYGDQCVDSYQVYQDLWYCSCGAVNRKEEAACYSCGLSAATLATIDLKVLKAELEERLAAEEKIWTEQEKLRAAERVAKQKRAKKLGIVLAMSFSAIVIITVAGVIITNYIKSEREEAARLAEYNEAVSLLDEGNYTEAIERFTELGDYRDSVAQIERAEAEQKEAANLATYNRAVTLLDEGKYNEAITLFRLLGDYSDSATQVEYAKAAQTEQKETEYNEAVTLINERKYSEAIAKFKELGNYGDSAAQLEQALEQMQVAAHEAGKILSANYGRTMGVCADGTVVAVGDNEYGKCDVSDWRNIVAISAGSDHTIGLRSEGTVVAAGKNKYGQCEVSDWSDIMAISAGSGHTVGLRLDGTVVTVGLNEYGQCEVSDWSDIVAVSAGGLHTVGLRSDGTVVAVGWNGHGQCAVSDWSDIVAISACYNYTVGLRSDGTVMVVGENKYDRHKVSDWSDIVAVSTGVHTVGLRSDGTVVAVGGNDDGQCNVSNWSDIVAVSAGFDHTVGLRKDGTVVAAGGNLYGQCDVSEWILKSPDNY